MPNNSKDHAEEDVRAELEQMRERAAALQHILENISQSTDDEQPVFKAIVHHAAKLFDAPFAGLFLLDESRQHFKPAAYLGANSNYSELANKNWALDEKSVSTLAIRKKGLFIFRIWRMPTPTGQVILIW